MISLKFKFLFIIIFLLFICSCKTNKDAVTPFNDLSISNGIAQMELWDGFDFSEGKVIFLEPGGDSLQFIRDINNTDIKISGGRDSVNNNVYYTFYLRASPVTKHVISGSGHRYWITNADSSMPAIDSINVLDIEKIDNIFDIEFKHGFNFYDIKSLMNYVYAIKTQDSLYGLIQILDVDTLSEKINIKFKWKYQSNGTKYF